MKHLKVFLLLLLVAPSASAQTDSTKVQMTKTVPSFYNGILEFAKRKLEKL